MGEDGGPCWIFFWGGGKDQGREKISGVLLGRMCWIAPNFSKKPFLPASQFGMMKNTDLEALPVTLLLKPLWHMKNLWFQAIFLDSSGA